MHIVLANRWYPPQANGGVAAYNYYLAQALIKQGHRVTVVAARSSAQEPAIRMDEGIRVFRLLTRHYSRLHRLPIIGRYMRPLQQMLYSHKVARQLRQFEASDPPDLIEFAEVNAEGWAYLRRHRRRPVVVRCHTPTFVLRDYYTVAEMPYDTALTTRLEQFCIQHADALTAPSQDMANTVAHYMTILPERFHVIPNPIDVAQFAVESKKSEEKGELIILHVGRLERIKGVGVLAQAIPQVLAEVPSARFVFIGGASSDEETTRWVEKLQQAGEKHVSVLGFLEEEEMIGWYQCVDIAVVPSLNYESFSYTCAQAMAAGLPVVASHIGGIPETVSDGKSGILVRPGDVNSLVKALVKLARNPALRRSMGATGCQRATQHFSAPIVAEQCLAVYQKLLP